MKMKRRRVTQSFSAQQSTSRARGNFAVGDLLILQESPETPDQMSFVRMNGLRPNLGRELHYLLESGRIARKNRSRIGGTDHRLPAWFVMPPDLAYPTPWHFLYSFPLPQDVAREGLHGGLRRQPLLLDEVGTRIHAAIESTR